MACNSDYLEADKYEREISRVACLLDELAGRQHNPRHWDGYHPNVYNKCTKDLGDELVKKLCTELQSRDVTKLSLEMQIWWRDHKQADRQRRQVEGLSALKVAAQQAALDKPTPQERKLLGYD